MVAFVKNSKTNMFALFAAVVMVLAMTAFSQEEAKAWDWNTTGQEIEDYCGTDYIAGYVGISYVTKSYRHTNANGNKVYHISLLTFPGSGSQSYSVVEYGDCSGDSVDTRIADGGWFA